MAGDYSKIHRLLKLLMVAQSASAQTPKDIARDLDINERTLFRDLNALKAAGFPIDFDDRKKRYVIKGATYMKPVDLTIDEALAIVALGRHLDTQIPGMQAGAAAVEKIRMMLPPGIREEVADLDPYLHIKLAPAAPADEATDIYLVVRDALAQHVKLSCEYESNTSQSDAGATFLFSPYSLFFNERAWYVLGFHEGRKEVRMLKLNRFANCKLTAEPYTMPAGFSLQAHLGNAWRMIRGKTYDVEIHFDKAFASTVSETQWHATQETELQNDGSLIFRCKVDGLEEIIWWVMSMGPHCKVIQPAELAQRVQKLAQDIVANYAKK